MTGHARRIRRCLVILVVIAVAGCRTPAADPSLEETVNAINERCPLMVDSETRFDLVRLEDGPALVYHFTLVNLDAARVDTAEFRRQLRPGLLAGIRVSPEMKQLRDQGVVFVYSYWDRHNKPFYKFTFSKEDYR